jgi:hypothetical protein
MANHWRIYMNEFTVGDLRRQLKFLDDDVKLSFCGGLTFYRLKRWGDNEFIVEFNEPEAYLPESFRKKNPDVKVAFIDISKLDDSNPIEMIDIEVK